MKAYPCTTLPEFRLTEPGNSDRMALAGLLQHGRWGRPCHAEDMEGKRASAELMRILAVDVALGGLMLNGLSRVDALQSGIRRIGERVAHIEGLIECGTLSRPAVAPAPASTGN